MDIAIDEMSAVEYRDTLLFRKKKIQTQKLLQCHHVRASKAD